MSFQQIPTLLKTMTPRFSNQTAIKITPSQYVMMQEVVNEYCETHEAPRLYGILARINRRMKQANKPHLWQTEYDYFAENMMKALHESENCRGEDALSDIDEIFQRRNHNSIPGHKRHNDKSKIMSIFG